MFDSLNAICEKAAKEKKSVWQVVIEDDACQQDISVEDNLDRMMTVYQAMRASDENYDPSQKSNSGLVGCEAEKVRKARLEGSLMCGDLVSRIMERALRVAESNACMKKIVAAPTAGSCGVMPAVLLTIQEEYGYSDEDMAKALKDLAEAEDSKMLFGAPEAQPVATGSPIGTIKTPARPMNTLDEIYKGNPYYHPSTSNV